MTLRAELKSIHSPDVDDLPLFVPEDPQRFSFLLQAMLGPEHESGEESFDIIVCTPLWLLESNSYGVVTSGLHHLIVKHYDYAGILSYIDNFAKQCVGDTWEDVATKLSRFGKWEFEDYRSS